MAAKTQWTHPARIEQVIAATSCTAEQAREYLIAEEGDIGDAISSYLGDRRMSIDDCVRMVTAAASFDDLKKTEPTYYPKFYVPAANKVEAEAQQRVVSAWNAWAAREGRLALAFIAANRKAA